MMATWQQALDSVGIPLAALVVVVALAVLALLVLSSRRRRARRQPALEAPRQPTVGVDEVAKSSLRGGLAKTRSGMLQRLLPLLGRSQLGAGEIEALEEVLLAADVGPRTTERLLQVLRESPTGLHMPLAKKLAREALAILEAPFSETGRRPTETSKRPHVIMVVGVNGVGKTTSIGKLAARYQRSGKRTLLVAADTFRAAAIEQLAVWSERTGADLVRHQHGADPGAVAFDGLRAARSRGVDVVIVDTAGRLHTKSNLMDELRKVRRVLAREIEGAPHETLLVIDAVTGQNGLAQARAFMEHLAVTGIVLTKLDGTAKGGIVLAIAGELGLPIRYVGIGETIEDLRDFEPKEFVSALLEPTEASELP
jgi:fused signal recognition particle receptor